MWYMVTFTLHPALGLSGEDAAQSKSLFFKNCGLVGLVGDPNIRDCYFFGNRIIWPWLSQNNTK